MGRKSFDLKAEEGRRQFAEAMDYPEKHPEKRMTRIASMTPKEEWEMAKKCTHIEDFEGYNQLKEYVEKKEN